MGIVGFIIFLFLIDSPELVGMQHEVTASNPESASNYRRIDDSDESDAEPDATVRAENADQVSAALCDRSFDCFRFCYSACFSFDLKQFLNGLD